MKKLLGFIFLSLFYCNLGFADVFLKNCRSTLPAGYVNPVDGKVWENGRVDELDKGEHFEIFVDFNKGYIFRTWVKSEADILATELLQETFESLTPNKVSKANYKIDFVDEKQIIGTRIIEFDPTINTVYEEITINLDSNVASTKFYGDSTDSIRMVKRMQNSAPRSCNKDDSSNSTEGGSGTAFFINNRGNLITNNHVVEGCKTLKINYFNKELEVDLISTDKTLDLALLKVKLKPKSFISFSKKEPKKRQVVIVAGYPLGQYLSDDLKINEGKISSLKGFENNSNEITVDLAINPGNSGGPIVNENGQLVAVAVAGMSKEVTEGISFGIKSSAVTNFLKTNKINSEINRSSFSMNDEKVNQLLEESTVYISCEL
jgi:S1-C subfamily serine protease